MFYASFVCFLLFYYHSLDDCLLSKKRQKGCGFRWEGVLGESRRSWGRGNCNWNILYKKIFFQSKKIEEKTERKKSTLNKAHWNVRYTNMIESSLLYMCKWENHHTEPHSIVNCKIYDTLNSNPVDFIPLTQTPRFLCSVSQCTLYPIWPLPHKVMLTIIFCLPTFPRLWFQLLSSVQWDSSNQQRTWAFSSLVGFSVFS